MSTLYLAHFGLHEPPFSITPNPRYFFAGGERGRLLEALTIAVTTDEGITAVTGAVGSGKTLLARLLVARLSEMGWHVAYLANPAFAPNEIVAAIAHDLGVLANPDANGATSVAADPLPGATLLDRLNAALIARYQAGQRTAVVIDEAHAMTPAALDEVRRLANLETAQHKLLQIVLFAQPELTTLLADPLLLPLRERIVHRFTLSPLPKMTVAEYIAFRLRTAGLAGENPFTQAALNRIARASGGIARRINLLADKAMLSAFARGAKRVTPADVRRAERELAWELPKGRFVPPRFWRIALVLAVVAVLAVAIVAIAHRDPTWTHFADGAASPASMPLPKTPPPSEHESEPSPVPQLTLQTPVAPSPQSTPPKPTAAREHAAPPTETPPVPVTPPKKPEILKPSQMAANLQQKPQRTGQTPAAKEKNRELSTTSNLSTARTPKPAPQQATITQWQRHGYTYAIVLDHWPTLANRARERRIDELRKQLPRSFAGYSLVAHQPKNQNEILILLGPFRRAEEAGMMLPELPSALLLKEPRVVALTTLKE
ncbi:ExeA family protein [Hydrogenophilus hirschii]